jgi:hypothetical protein
VLAGLDVVENGLAVVALGNSITDGRGSGTNRDDRWPDNLARRLQADPRTRRVAVLNAGIGGNAVLTGGLGPTALARLDRDVLAQSGARWVILLEGRTTSAARASRTVRPQWRRICWSRIGSSSRACTLAVCASTGPRSRRSAGPSMMGWSGSWRGRRGTVGSGRAERSMRSSTSTRCCAIRPSRHASSRWADTGDHLHPNEEGYRMMADAIDLALFIP